MTLTELKQARHALGLSVERFAALVSATGRTVRRWEDGTRDIDKRVLPIIERELVVRRSDMADALHAIRMSRR